MKLDENLILDFLNLHWLRPENVIFDIARYRHVRPIFKNTLGDISEIGIGNGISTFTLLGGKFSETFDWYQNINYDNKDIYDHYKIDNTASQILNPPEKKVKYGCDIKINLLNQAVKLGVVENIEVVDANNKFQIPNVDLIYSNMIYWLNDPVKVIDSIGSSMQVGSQLLLVFPNSKFFEYCKSYTSESKFLNLINGGRKEHILWHKDLEDFVKIIENLNFRLVMKKQYACKSTLNTWDIGLRPFFKGLHKMANSVNLEKKLELKRYWIEEIKDLVVELVSEEFERGESEGGFNLVILEKC